MQDNGQVSCLESTNKLDLTGKQQLGFKRNKGTATAANLFQSLIAPAADNKSLNTCFMVKSKRMDFAR